MKNDQHQCRQLKFDFEHKRHISSGALESLLTAHHITGRVLGRSENVSLENMMTVFITGNGASISPDLRRRVLQIELRLLEARAEDRIIKNPLNDATIIGYRSAILSALWSITLDWERASQPLSTTRLNSYESWSEVIGGILEHAGFVSPCLRNPAASSGDRDTIEMIKLVDVMTPKREYKFTDIVELAQTLELFERVVGDGLDGEPLQRDKRAIFSKILGRFNDRVFPGGKSFHHARRGKDTSLYYIEEVKK